MSGILAFVGYLLTIPAANWMISNVGSCVPNGPCLIPVGFGLEAPSGVLLVGLALVLRDLVHSRLGVIYAFGAIVVGTGLSLVVANPGIAMASAVAFLLSEAADTAVYAPLRERRLNTAVLISGLVGAAVDSAVFLMLAFGSLAFVEGQIVGKLMMSLAALPLIWLIRRRAA